MAGPARLRDALDRHAVGNPRQCRSRSGKRLVVSLLLLLWCLPSVQADPWVGRPLAEAILDLERLGLAVFFTNQVVDSSMRVLEEPTAETPTEILAQLLAPHGLEATRGPGGRWVVVEAGPRRLVGRVVERTAGTPLEGALVVVLGTDRQSRADAEGRFEIVGIEPGEWTVEARIPGFVVAQAGNVVVRPFGATTVDFELDAAPLTSDEIIVTPSRMSLMRDEPVSAVDLQREDILALPHLGDDIFRAFTLLPGIAGEEASAQFNVRGGRTDEVLVLLDRFELLEAYHLKDFSSALSIVAPRALREVNLLTGGFPAEYGDRMSGVLDMTTLDPDQGSIRLGLGTLTAEVSGSGLWGGGEGSWLGSLRRGTLDLTLDLLGFDERPQYWDVFGKLDRSLRPGRDVGLRMLHSEDRLDSFVQEDDDQEDYRTSYSNTYLWLAHQEIFGSRLFVESVASFGRVERDRRGVETDGEEGGFLILDRRALEAIGLKQDWQGRLGSHDLKWGFDLRRLDAEYDYFNNRELEDPLAAIRSEPRTGTTRLVETFEGDQIGLYLSDRIQLTDPLTLELGLRYDEHDLTRDQHFSPRFNLHYALDDDSSLRVAWGLFYQSQRPYELQVEDGESLLAGAERTEHRILGYERRFELGPGPAEVSLRIEAYQRQVRDPRVRYENLFEPISVFPEIEPDRFRFAPERSEAHGIEVFLRGTARRGLQWWLSYSYARTRDRIDGRLVPRRFDQPHALNLDLDFDLGEHWHLNLAWRYHTGWPTTSVFGELAPEESDDLLSGISKDDEEDEPEFVLGFGPIHGERLPPYHRLDLRASREWQRPGGTLGFFLEVQNLYDRENVAGFDVDFELALRPDGIVDVTTVNEIWGGIRPSFGFTWEF